MRDVATAAGVSLGAAYYYFASKEAIVAAYYDHVQARHQAACREAFAAALDLRAGEQTAGLRGVDSLPGGTLVEEPVNHVDLHGAKREQDVTPLVRRIATAAHSFATRQQ